MPRNIIGSGILQETDRNLLTLEEAVSRHIRRALEISKGKISGDGGAAQILGTNPNTLRSRMRKLGISFRYSGK
jgi:transcriptional regulator with GAF, ATPase, and Fis domain